MDSATLTSHTTVTQIPKCTHTRAHTYKKPAQRPHQPQRNWRYTQSPLLTNHTPVALFWATALIFNVFWLLVGADVWAFRLPQTLLLSHYRGQSNNLPPLGGNTQTTSGQLHTLTRKHIGMGTHVDTHIDAHGVAHPCTHPEITPPTQWHTHTHTRCVAHTQSLFSLVSLMHSLCSSHQLAMLCASVCPDLS